MMMNSLTLIQTGGTIDKDYPKAIGGYNFEICESAGARLLKNINPELRVNLVECLKLDSQDITDDDRQLIGLAVSQAGDDHILITHGTDTMINTAQFLARYIADTRRHHDYKIVITGSLKPERFKDSDADFNIGFAVGCLTCLTGGGVYVAMNGTLTKHDNVTRQESGRFTTLI